ncbi:LLM class flavin-dependent oxidoreductase [uncultured Paraglaciecola sp.]|jgi:luciferase family oxidoreductase group 1|uniref:LLM class flavin-dependent oxidoreductase n=1 Tax=uncultured Paraglaciecola sp. TaxID=1765024 RepID=UPI0025DADED1|nr:LLM class flavin-dependent oxidoreductase [uncultured Paraglaciecola sp.]
MTLPFSILDLAPIAEGSSIANAFNNSRKLAVQAEASGYNRVWLAEHHGMFGVASSATAVVLGHIAAATSKIRIGSGGVMLPNHSPLVIAEQFGTLATLYPDRVDLGLGRAPGTDMATARALRRNLTSEVDNYPDDIRELQHYFSGPTAGQNIVAVPGANTHVPIWLLGSSLYSAKLAGQFGLPYSFASHFAPDQLFDAISLYRATFQASEQAQKPYMMAGLMAVVADSDEEADYLFTSVQQQFMNLRRGVNRPFARPVDDLSKICTDADQAMLSNILRYAMVGSKQTVTDKLSQFIEATNVHELIVSMPIHDANARLKSVQLLAETGLMKVC